MFRARNPPLSVRCREFQLDIIWVTEGKNVNTETWAQILDLSMRNALLLKVTHGFFELVVIAHIQAQMIQPDAVFVKAIVEDRLARVRRFGQCQDGLSVG